MRPHPLPYSGRVEREMLYAAKIALAAMAEKQANVDISLCAKDLEIGTSLFFPPFSTS